MDTTDHKLEDFISRTNVYSASRQKLADLKIIFVKTLRASKTEPIGLPRKRWLFFINRAVFVAVGK